MENCWHEIYQEPPWPERILSFLTVAEQAHDIPLDETAFQTSITDLAEVERLMEYAASAGIHFRAVDWTKEGLVVFLQNQDDLRLFRVIFHESVLNPY